jgi:hypothetical protein
MAKNFIEFDSSTTNIVSYSNYDSTKTVLGPDIYQFSGSSPYDYYIGPNQTAFRDITQDTGVSNWGDIDAVTYSGDTQWVFVLKGFSTSVSTTDIAMYEFNKTNFTYNYVGAISCTGVDTAARIQQGIKSDISYYTGGTVEVNGTSVSGTSTDWMGNRIPIGAKIGFGSSDPDDISTWYRITDYPLMNSIPTLVNNTVSCVAVDSSGGIYIGGNFTTYNSTTQIRIVKLNSDGTVDTSFNGGTGFNNIVTTIKIDSSGGIYVGGDFTTYQGVAANRIIKLNPDGTKDTSFDNTTGFNLVVQDIQFDSLGSIWVCGQFTTYKGVSAPYLTKLLPTGLRDTSYPNTLNPNTIVYSISVDTNDDVYVGGNFTQVGTTANNSRFIAKILKTGGLDSTFVVGTAGSANAFNGTVYSVLYEPSTNSVIVGGVFSTWRGNANSNLTKISATGNVLISTASPVVVYSLRLDSLGNFYSYGTSQLVTKRDVNTLVCDPNFTPNIVYSTLSTNFSDNIMALSPSGNTLYVVSASQTVDSGIVAVETTGGTRNPNFLTTPDYSSQVISIDSSAGIFSSGTPYVIRMLTISLQRATTGTFLLQGIDKDDFNIIPTLIPLPSFNFMALAKGIYDLQDGAYITNNFSAGNVNNTSAKDTRIKQKQPDGTQNLYVISNAGRVSKFNIRDSYVTQIGAGATGRIRYSTFSQLMVTGNGVIRPSGAAVSGFGSGKFTIGTMQSGSASGITSIYLDNSGVVQTPISDLLNEVSPIYSYMPEVPPGSTTTYNSAGNVGRVYYMPTIDKLVVLNSSSTAKSYITKYETNLQQPTLVSSFYGRDTYNELSYNNSYDLTFLMNGNQLQGNTANIDAPRYPDTLGGGFLGSVENGVLHLCRPLSTIQNNLYAIPLGCESQFVDYSNNVFITPKYTLPNTIGIYGLFVNQLKEYGSGAFVTPPEPLIIHYRTTGIDTNTGEWTEFTNVQNLNNDIICEGVLDSITIQFRFSYKIAGNTCLPNRVYGFTLVYEDDRTDSHYSPSVSKSNLTNRIFAWRQESLWGGNIPNLKIRLYNATNNNIVFYDTVTNSSSGTWEYSTDNGVTWLPWNSSADSVGNYIRYVADFIPSGIKLRVGLNSL